MSAGVRKGRPYKGLVNLDQSSPLLRDPASSRLKLGPHSRFIRVIGGLQRQQMNLAGVRGVHHVAGE